MTLAEAVPLKGIISRHIQELIRERNDVAFVEAEKGEEYEKPLRSVEKITEELERVRKDFRMLDILINKANLENTICWDEENISIKEAIELAKQLREEANRLKSLGNAKKIERTSRGLLNNHLVLLRIAQFEPEEYRKRGIKLERQVNKLSALIEHANHFVTIEFDDTKYAGEE
ncbi:hypothetical protein JK635_08285 [Neobacillus sp. YIM B02564]|uniref:Uncharacterized protein n=1 Tax=Neobacillus paridis TaxID=2803862 RepID=A0ABS1TLK6_9BACI|nr:hypothetical protein [Neobacillus paridis]